MKLQFIISKFIKNKTFIIFFLSSTLTFLMYSSEKKEPELKYSQEASKALQKTIR